MKLSKFNDEVEVQYVFRKAKTVSDKLIVVFPNLRTRPSPPTVFHLFEYSSVTNIYQLFIADSWADVNVPPYAALNGDFCIERSIIKLIDRIRDEYGIKNICATGTSAGATAALYYGLKYNWHILGGSPRYEFSTRHNNASYRLVSGLESDESANEFMRTLVPDVLRNIETGAFRKRFICYWGDLESSYLDNCDKLSEDCRRKDISLEIRTFEGISEHGYACVAFDNISVAALSEVFDENITRYALMREQRVHLMSEMKALADRLTAIINASAIPAEFPVVEPFEIVDPCIIRDLTYEYVKGGITDEYFWSAGNETTKIAMAKMSLSQVYMLCVDFEKKGDVSLLLAAGRLVDSFALKETSIFRLGVLETKTCRMLRMIVLCKYIEVYNRQNPKKKDGTADSLLKRDFLAHMNITDIALSPRYTTAKVFFSYAALYRENAELSAALTKYAIRFLVDSVLIQTDRIGFTINYVVETFYNYYSLKRILKFVLSNNLPVSSEYFVKLSKLVSDTERACSHLSVWPPSSGYSRQSPFLTENLMRILNFMFVDGGDFIDGGHALKVLRTDKSYLSANGLYTSVWAMNKKDALSLTWYYCGFAIVKDCCAMYSNDMWEICELAVAAHSCVYADTGEYFLDMFEFKSAHCDFGEYAVLRSVNAGYADVELQRLIVFLKSNAIIVIDRCKSLDGKKHKYYQNWLLNGLENPITDFSEFSGRIRAATVDMHMRQFAKFDSVTYDRAPPNAEYLNNNESESAPVEHLRYEVTAEEHVFVSVLTAVSAENAAENNVVEISAENDGAVCRLKLRSETKTVELDILDGEITNLPDPDEGREFLFHLRDFK
jgi:hypothetical protein